MGHTNRSLVPGRERFEQLLCRARQDARYDLGAFFEAFRRFLLALGRRRLPGKLRSKASAADFVQETFIDCQRVFATFQGNTVEAACAWLRRIYFRRVSHFCRQFLDYKKRQIARELSLTCPQVRAELEAVPSIYPSPLDAAITSDQMERFMATLAKLREVHQHVIRLHVLQHHSFDEVGIRLHCSPEAARKLCGRAMRKLIKLGGFDRADTS